MRTYSPLHARKGDLLLYIQSEVKAVLQDGWVDSHHLDNPAFHCGLYCQKRGTGNFGKKLSFGMPKLFLLISQGDFTGLLYWGNLHDPFCLLPSIPPDHHPTSDMNASWAVTSEPRCNNNLVPCPEFPRGLLELQGCR